MRQRSVELVRGLTALLLLAGLLLGLPTALVTVVGWPLSIELPTWSSLERALTTGEFDNWTLVKGLALLVWLAWAQLATSTIAEAIAIARGHRMGRVPTARPLRVIAANLVTTAALLFGSAGRVADAAVLPPSDLHVALATGPSSAPVAGDGPTHRPFELRSTLVADPVVDATPNAEASDRRADPPTWTVAPRDTLWGIAETALGNGLRWREIHDLNVGRPQPDSGALRAGEDLIHPGWILHLPPDARLAHQTENAVEDPSRSAIEASTDTITVQPGDTLWDLADQHLDDPHRWPELHDANHDRPQPDGSHLTDPDLIRPGWRLAVPTDTADALAAPPDVPTEPAPAAEGSKANSTSPTTPLPWAWLDNHAPPLLAPDADAPMTPDAVLRDRGTGEATQPDDVAAKPPDERAEAGLANDPNAWDRSVFLAGAGVAAAGVVLTLDRLRRSRQRRRALGQRIRLPDGDLPAAERRVRGLADPETADLLDVALRSLAAACAREDRPVPDIALVSVSIDDVAIHLVDSDTDSVENWRLEDAGMTWVLPRPADLEPLRALATTALSPAPLLVTIGTHADSQRRVLLNLGHARLISIAADEQTMRTVLLGQALELATSTRADGLQVLLSGAEGRLATLERIRCTPDTEALQTLQRAATDDADADDADATVSVFLEPPPPELLDTFPTIASQPSGTVAAVAAGLPDAPWRLTIDETVVLVAPYGLKLQPLELTAGDIDAVEQLLVDAANPTFVGAQLADLDEFEPEAPVAPSSNGHVAAATAPEVDSDDQRRVEVRVLGPVEVTGADDFASAKAQELVVYLALHRDGVDADALQEALWPGEAPNAGRLHTTVWRARQALRDDADGDPYLPKAKQGRYRLSDALAVDLEHFQAQVSRARSDPDDAAGHLRGALERVRGAPLTATNGGYAWTTYDVYGIEQRISDAAHELAKVHLERDEPELARWAAERGLLADPYCEALHRDLMSAASHAGNTSEIPVIMRRLRRLIDADGDANDGDDSPDRQTIDLYQRLTNGGATVRDRR